MSVGSRPDEPKLTPPPQTRAIDRRPCNKSAVDLIFLEQSSRRQKYRLAMSVVTITDTETGSTEGSSRFLRLIPTDYDIFTTEGTEQTETLDDSPNSRTEQTEAQMPVTNPPWWPTNHRRMPPYRPVNRNLDRTARPSGENAIVFLFINSMLGGCGLLAVRSMRNLSS